VRFSGLLTQTTSKLSYVIYINDFSLFKYKRLKLRFMIYVEQMRKTSL